MKPYICKRASRWMIMVGKWVDLNYDSLSNCPIALLCLCDSFDQAMSILPIVRFVWKEHYQQQQAQKGKGDLCVSINGPATRKSLMNPESPPLKL